MITYNAEDVKVPKIRKRETTTWIRRVAATYGRRIGEVGYLFVSDNTILDYNKKYLGRNYFTDIITFDYDEDDVINGDVIISIETVKANAERYNVSFDDELHRVIIHGILHLCGINDEGPGEFEQMKVEEEKALALLKDVKTKDRIV